MSRGSSFAVVVAEVVVAALIFVPGSGFAHFQTYPYTLQGCAPSDGPVDPINFAFIYYGDGPHIVNQIEAHSSWDNPSTGTVQSFLSHDSCGPMYQSRAEWCWDGSNQCSRFHIRVKKTYDDDVTYGTTGRGDAHHEDWVWTCNYGLGGHAVDQNGSNGSGFDQGRRELRVAFENAGHGWSSNYWDNRWSFKQCDGGYASSDGYTVYVALHSNYH